MAVDPLKKWRERSGKAASPPAATLVKDSGAEEEQESAPADVQGKNRSNGWLKIILLKGPWALLSYSEMLRVYYDGENPSFVVLIFRDGIVKIRGQDMSELMAGLEAKVVAVIAESDPRKKEAAKGELFIESIEISMRDEFSLGSPATKPQKEHA